MSHSEDKNTNMLFFDSDDEEPYESLQVSRPAEVATSQRTIEKEPSTSMPAIGMKTSLAVTAINQLYMPEIYRGINGTVKDDDKATVETLGDIGQKGDILNTDTSTPNVDAHMKDVKAYIARILCTAKAMANKEINSSIGMFTAKMTPNISSTQNKQQMPKDVHVGNDNAIDAVGPATVNIDNNGKHGTFPNTMDCSEKTNSRMSISNSGQGGTIPDVRDSAHRTDFQTHMVNDGHIPNPKESTQKTGFDMKDVKSYISNILIKAQEHVIKEQNTTNCRPTAERMNPNILSAVDNLDIPKDVQIENGNVVNAEVGSTAVSNRNDGLQGKILTTGESTPRVDYQKKDVKAYIEGIIIKAREYVIREDNSTVPISGRKTVQHIVSTGGSLQTPKHDDKVNGKPNNGGIVPSVVEHGNILNSTGSTLKSDFYTGDVKSFVKNIISKAQKRLIKEDKMVSSKSKASTDQYSSSNFDHFQMRKDVKDVSVDNGITINAKFGQSAGIDIKDVKSYVTNIVIHAQNHLIKEQNIATLTAKIIQDNNVAVGKGQQRNSNVTENGPTVDGSSAESIGKDDKDESAPKEYDDHLQMSNDVCVENGNYCKAQTSAGFDMKDVRSYVASIVSKAQKRLIKEQNMVIPTAKIIQDNSVAVKNRQQPNNNLRENGPTVDLSSTESIGKDGKDESAPKEYDDHLQMSNDVSVENGNDLNAQTSAGFDMKDVRSYVASIVSKAQKRLINEQNMVAAENREQPNSNLRENGPTVDLSSTESIGKDGKDESAPKEYDDHLQMSNDVSIENGNDLNAQTSAGFDMKDVRSYVASIVSKAQKRLINEQNMVIPTAKIIQDNSVAVKNRQQPNSNLRENGPTVDGSSAESIGKDDKDESAPKKYDDHLQMSNDVSVDNGNYSKAQTSAGFDMKDVKSFVAGIVNKAQKRVVKEQNTVIPTANGNAVDGSSAESIDKDGKDASAPKEYNDHLQMSNDVSVDNGNTLKAQTSAGFDMKDVRSYVASIVSKAQKRLIKEQNMVIPTAKIIQDNSVAVGKGQQQNSNLTENGPTVDGSSAESIGKDDKDESAPKEHDDHLLMSYDVSVENGNYCKAQTSAGFDMKDVKSFVAGIVSKAKKRVVKEQNTVVPTANGNAVDGSSTESIEKDGKDASAPKKYDDHFQMSNDVSVENDNDLKAQPSARFDMKDVRSYVASIVSKAQKRLIKEHNMVIPTANIIHDNSVAVENRQQSNGKKTQGENGNNVDESSAESINNDGKDVSAPREYDDHLQMPQDVCVENGNNLKAQTSAQVDMEDVRSYVTNIVIYAQKRLMKEQDMVIPPAKKTKDNSITVKNRHQPNSNLRENGNAVDGSSTESIDMDGKDESAPKEHDDHLQMSIDVCVENGNDHNAQTSAGFDIKDVRSYVASIVSKAQKRLINEQNTVIPTTKIIPDSKAALENPQKPKIESSVNDYAIDGPGATHKGMDGKDPNKSLKMSAFQTNIGNDGHRDNILSPGESTQKTTFYVNDVKYYVDRVIEQAKKRVVQENITDTELPLSRKGTAIESGGKYSIDNKSREKKKGGTEEVDIDMDKVRSYIKQVLLDSQTRAKAEAKIGLNRGTGLTITKKLKPPKSVDQSHDNTVKASIESPVEDNRQEKIVDSKFLPPKHGNVFEQRKSTRKSDIQIKEVKCYVEQVIIRAQEKLMKEEKMAKEMPNTGTDYGSSVISDGKMQPPMEELKGNDNVIEHRQIDLREKNDINSKEKIDIDKGKVQSYIRQLLLDAQNRAAMEYGLSNALPKKKLNKDETFEKVQPSESINNRKKITIADDSGSSMKNVVEVETRRDITGSSVGTATGYIDSGREQGSIHIQRESTQKTDSQSNVKVSVGEDIVFSDKLQVRKETLGGEDNVMRAEVKYQTDQAGNTQGMDIDMGKVKSYVGQILTNAKRKVVKDQGLTNATSEKELNKGLSSYVNDGLKVVNNINKENCISVEKIVGCSTKKVVKIHKHEHGLYGTNLRLGFKHVRPSMETRIINSQAKATEQELQNADKSASEVLKVVSKTEVRQGLFSESVDDKCIPVYGSILDSPKMLDINAKNVRSCITKMQFKIESRKDQGNRRTNVMFAEDIEGRFASTLFERLQLHSLSRYSLGQNCNALDGGDVISVESIGNSTKTPTQDMDRENVISFAMNAENTTANETDEGSVGDYINDNRKDNGIFDSSGVDSDWMEARICVEDILNQIEEEADTAIELNESSVSTLRQQQMKTWYEDSVNPAVAGISAANAIEEIRDIYATNMVKPKVMNEVSVAKPTAERTGIISAYVEVEKRKENGIVDSTGDKNTSLDMRNSDIVDKGNGIYNLPSTEIPILKRESTFKEKCGFETMDKIEYDTFYEKDQTDITQREVSPVSAIDFDMLNVKLCLDSMLNEVSRRLFKEKLKEMISDTMCRPSSTKYADETSHWKTSGLSRDMTSQQLSLKLDDLDFPSNQSLLDGYKIPETPRPSGPYMTEMKEDEIAKNSICSDEPFIFSKGLKLSWTPGSSVINVPTMEDDSSESDVSISPPIRSVRKYSFTEAVRNSSPLGYFREQHSPFQFTLEYFEQFREWEECGYVPELPLRRPDLERVILHEILEQSPWERREATPPPLSPLTIDSTYMFTYDRSDEESENEETCLKEASLKNSSAESAVGCNQAKCQDYKRHAMIDENVTGTSTNHGLDEDKPYVPTIVDSTDDEEAPRKKLEISAKVSLPILPCKPKILKEDNGESKPLRFTEKKGLSTLMTLPRKPVITTTSKMPIVKPAQQTPTKPTERKQKLMIDEIDKLAEMLPKLSKNIEMKPSNWKNRSQCKIDKLGEIFGLRENIKAPSRIPIRSTGHENGRTQQMETKVPLEEKQVIKCPVSPEVDIIKSQQEPGVTEKVPRKRLSSAIERMANPSDCKVNGAEAIPGKEKHEEHIETLIDRATTKSGNGLSESISESLPKPTKGKQTEFKQQSRTNSTQINGDDQQIEKGNESRKSADHERTESDVKKRGEVPLNPVHDTGQFIQAQDDLTEGAITSLTMLENTHQSGKGNVQNEPQECEMLIDKIQEEGSLLNIEKSKPRKSASFAMSRPAKNASSENHKIVKLFDNVFEGKETLISHEDQAKRGKTESKVKNRKDTIGRMRVKSEPRPTERMSPGNKPDSNPPQSQSGGSAQVNQRSGRTKYRQQKEEANKNSEPFSVKAVPDNGPLPPIRDRIIPGVKGTDNIPLRSNRKLPSLVDNSIHNRPPWNASTKVKTEWEEERSRRNKKIKTGSAKSKPEEPLPTLLISKLSKYKPLPEISKSDDYKLNLTGHLNGISREHGHLEGRNNLNQLPALPSIGSRLETRKDKKNALKNGKNAGSASGCLDSGGITNVKGRKKHGPSTSSSNINKIGSNATKNEGETKSKGTGQPSNTANKNENNRRTKSRYTVAVSCLSESVKSADSPRKSRSSSVSSVLADNTMDKPPSRISSSSSSVPAEDRSVSTTPSIWFRAPSRGKLILNPDLGNYSAKIYRPDAKDGDGEKSLGYYRDNVDKHGNGLDHGESNKSPDSVIMERVHCGTSRVESPFKGLSVIRASACGGTKRT